MQTLGAEDIQLLPAWEGEEEIADATDEIRADRLKVVARVSSLVTREEGKAITIAASMQAICQPIPKLSAIESGSLALQTGKQTTPEDVSAWLIDNGFERTDKVDLPGQFARRGGIVDIYAPMMGFAAMRPARSQALRVEFFGDTIESIRTIDLDTQVSTHQLSAVSIVSATCGDKQEQRELFLNILPADAIVILDEPADCQEVAKVYFERAEQKDRLYDWPEIHKSLERFTQLHISRFATENPDEFIKLDIRSVQQYQHKAASLWAGHKEALAELVELAKHQDVLLYCEAEAEIDRVSEIIRQEHGDIPPRFKLLKGFIHQGFAMPSLNATILSHHELFGQFALRRRQRPMRATTPIDTLEDLQQGDYVVHSSYGVGKFLGIETIREKTGQNEYLTIEYDGGVKVQVSVNNIGLVQKYIGTSPKRPKLSKVGSKRWQNQKEKVRNPSRTLRLNYWSFRPNARR